MPLLTYGAVTELAEGLLAQGLLSVTMFMAMPRPPISQLLVEWSGPSSPGLQNRVRSLYDIRSLPVMATPAPELHNEKALGPAQIVAGAFRLGHARLGSRRTSTYS